MNSVLAIICIILFAILTYGLIRARNLTKNHLIDCRTIYIPEEYDLEMAYKSINTNDINLLKKRASDLGASNDFLKKIKNEKNEKLKESKELKELKEFIILHSISNNHILFDKVETKIKEREKGRVRSRIKQKIDSMNNTQLKKQYDTSMNKSIIDKLLKKTDSKFTNPKLTINELKEDAGIEY